MWRVATTTLHILPPWLPGSALADPHQLAAHRAAQLPYLVYLRHPTTGGVLASWGSLGHVTAAGPHSGGEDIERLGDLENAMWVHVRVSAAFGVAFLALVAALQRFRDRARGTALLAGGVLALLLVQMVVGEVQWRNQLPWELVLGHVTLATLVWTGVVALAVVLRRPQDA